MGLPLYLAMTAAEIASCQVIPDRIAYMACHFSPYSTGLSNLPDTLPPGSILMVNDRIPIFGHDPDRICQQLYETTEMLGCSGVVLDLQRKGSHALEVLCERLTDSLPCPVAVSEYYSQGLSCPVFLCAPEVNRPLSEHVGKYKGRDIWLEAALDARCFTVTEEGCRTASLHTEPETDCFMDEILHCHYHIETEEKAARFRLWRTADDLRHLLLEAQALGISQTIGLYQQLSKYIPWD